MKVASFVMMVIMVYIYLLVLGLCFGSFVNAWVWRLRQQEDKVLSKKQEQALSVLHGRSMCIHCKHTLAWYDLLPVVSWLSLGGRCRYCRKPISLQYPLVEVCTAALFIVSYVTWPNSLQSSVSSLQFILWLVFVVCFMALIVYDMRWMLLPNKIVYPLVGLAIVYAGLNVAVADHVWVTIGSALGGLLAIGGLFWLLFQVSGGRWIGGGDVKLSFALGLLAGGPVLALLIVFVASVLGTVVALPQLAGRRLKTASKIPFGPFLIMATVIVVLAGQQMVDWYLGFMA